MKFSIKHITSAEVKRLIADLKNHKFSGSNQINCKIVNDIVLFCNILNVISRYPVQWKFTEMKMIFKHRKQENLPSSHRSISHLLIISKIFQKLLLDNIQSFYCIVRSNLKDTIFFVNISEANSTIHAQEYHKVIP